MRRQREREKDRDLERGQRNMLSTNEKAETEKKSETYCR